MEGPFQDPEIPDGERTAYRGLIGGEEAGRGEVVVKTSADAYEQSVQLSVGDAAEWRGSVRFRRRGGTIHAEESKLEIGSEGEAFATESSRFRHVKVVQFGGEVEPYPRDLAPLVGCAIALRGLELEPGAERAFTAWISSSVMWPVETRVEKQEDIEVPAGKLSAWRVRLRPSFEQVDAALDRLMDMLMPPIVVHLASDVPHRLIRAEFPTGPFKWNPPGLIEATDLGG